MLVEVVGSEYCTASFGSRTSASGPSMMDVEVKSVRSLVTDRLVPVSAHHSKSVNAAPPPSCLRRYAGLLMDVADRAGMITTLEQSIAIPGNWVAAARSTKSGSGLGMDEGIDGGHRRGWYRLELWLCLLCLWCACACSCCRESGMDEGMDEGMDGGHGRGWCRLELWLCLLCLSCACVCSCAGVCACVLSEAC